MISIKQIIMVPNSYFLLLSIAIFAIARFCAGEYEDKAPVVRVKQGLIKGILEESTEGKKFYSYMSIPYAEPPVGKLRFKGPVPSKPWEVLDGSKPPVECLQMSSFDTVIGERTTTSLRGKEDCLYLNVYTTTPNQPEKKLPVMVFIHGGALIIGGSFEYLPYALMNRDIVLVVFQYRLGVFGFFSTEDSVLPGNMGLKDQQLALKWTKENIEAFGGDPETITLFGESGGAAAVHYQLLSPGSAGLFQRAIIQSGAATCQWASNINHRKFAIETGRRFNCSIDNGTDTFLECLQGINALYLLLESMYTVKWGFSPYYVLPSVDGKFITDYPEILMKEGRYSKVNVMSGIARDEGAVVLSIMNLVPSLTKKLNDNFEEFGPPSILLNDEENAASLARQIYQHYLKREDISIGETDRQQLSRLYSDSYFRDQYDTMANIFARDNINLYLYQLDHYGQASYLDSNPNFNRSNLVAHGDDLAYLFQGGPLFPRPMVNEEDLKVRNIILSLWTNFAKTGNPNSGSFDFTWEKATKNNFRHLSLTTQPRMEDDTYGLQRKFWASLKTRSNLLLQRTDTKETQAEKQEF